MRHFHFFKIVFLALFSLSTIGCAVSASEIERSPTEGITRFEDYASSSPASIQEAQIRLDEFQMWYVEAEQVLNGESSLHSSSPDNTPVVERVKLARDNAQAAINAGDLQSADVYLESLRKAILEVLETADALFAKRMSCYEEALKLSNRVHDTYLSYNQQFLHYTNEGRSTGIAARELDFLHAYVQEIDGQMEQLMYCVVVENDRSEFLFQMVSQELNFPTFTTR